MYDFEDYKALLKQAGLLYQMHEAGRSDPFNVFSVLRKESDEVGPPLPISGRAAQPPEVA